MAGGWSRDGAVQEQIDASVEDAVKQARSLMPEGESSARCEEMWGHDSCRAPSGRPGSAFLRYLPGSS